MKNLHLAWDNSRAFTLIEFLIYLSLFVFVFVVFLGIVNREWIAILCVEQKQNAELELALASDVIRRDLLCASSAIDDWEESNFIIKRQELNASGNISEEWVHWYIKANLLMRAVGRYDCIKKIWQNRDTCLVCANIKQINLVLEKNDKLGAVVGAIVKVISTQKEDLERKIYVELRNRIKQ